VSTILSSLSSQTLWDFLIYPTVLINITGWCIKCHYLSSFCHRTSQKYQTVLVMYTLITSHFRFLNWRFPRIYGQTYGTFTYLHVLDPGMTIDEIACFGWFGRPVRFPWERRIEPDLRRGSFPGSSTHRRHPAGRGPRGPSRTRCFCVAKNPAFQHGNMIFSSVNICQNL